MMGRHIHVHLEATHDNAEGARKAWMSRKRASGAKPTSARGSTSQAPPRAPHSSSRPMTILSDDGRHRAVVTPSDEGAVSYYRMYVDNSGKMAGWRHLHSASVPQPFHAALNLAHDRVNAL